MFPHGAPTQAGQQHNTANTHWLRFRSHQHRHGGRLWDRSLAGARRRYRGLGLKTTRALLHARAEVIVSARSPERARTTLRGLVGASSNRWILVIRGPLSPSPTVPCVRPVCVDPRQQRGHHGHTRETGCRWARGAVRNEPYRPLSAHARPMAGPHRVGRCMRCRGVSSRGHQIAGIDCKDIDFRGRAYDNCVAYSQSETANAFVSMALDRRGRATAFASPRPYPDRPRPLSQLRGDHLLRVSR